MFAVVLWAHSLLRWLVLGAVAARAGRALQGRLTGAPFGQLDRRLSLVLVILVDLQLTIGVVLYLVSPTIRQALAAPGAAMKDGALRLLLVEHPITMILAVGLVHVAHVLGKRATAERSPHMAVFGCVLLALFLMLLRIPW